MPEINVLSKTQTIVVDPISGSVSIINAGPPGPAGLPGPPGSGGINDEDVEGGEIISYNSATGMASVLLDNGDIVDVKLLGITGGSGTTKVTISNQTLFTSLAPSSLFSWTEIDIGCSRMMVVRFTITSSIAELFGIQISGGPIGMQEQMFASQGFPDPVMSISWPWWYENQNDEQKMYIGIRNSDSVASNFTVTDLRGEMLG